MIMGTLDGEKLHCYISVLRIIIQFMGHLVPQIQESDNEFRINIYWIKKIKFQKFCILSAYCLWSRCVINAFKKLFLKW